MVFFLLILSLFLPFLGCKKSMKNHHVMMIFVNTGTTSERELTLL